MTQSKEVVIASMAKMLVAIGASEEDIFQLASECRKRIAFKRDLDNSPTGSSGVTKESGIPFKASGNLSQSEVDQLLKTRATDRKYYEQKVEALVDRPLIQSVMQELSRARAKHLPMNSLREGYAIILEELDELWDEIKQQKPDMARVEKEAVQVAAMAFRLVLDVARK